VVREVAASTIRLVPVRKPGRVRWLVRLDEPAAAAYAALVARVAPIVERSLSPAAIANRVVGVSDDPPAIHLEAWARARDRFRDASREIVSGAGAVVKTDVRACYASISAEVVGRSLERIGCDDGSVRPIVSALRAFAERGIRGLPIGPEASAVLANAVLARVDEALERADVRHLRWVDDVVAFTARPQEAERVLRVVGSALAELGLAPAREKTRVIVGPGAGSAPSLGSLSLLGRDGMA
jgi:Reverse transcriptase (RNA-dependent DNA polymerase)